MWMIIKGEQGNYEEVTDSHDAVRGTDYECRTSWNTLEDAQFAADFATVFMDVPFLAIDNGEYVHPRYDIIMAPQIGDEVSYSFNGDTYPAGKIVTISKTMKRITTDEGVIFYGNPETGTWKRTGGTFFLVKGRIKELNPCF